MNDFTVPPGAWSRASYDAHKAGTPAELYFSHERKLGNAPYLRIPGIDDSEARQIVQALKDTGVWNAEASAW